MSKRDAGMKRYANAGLPVQSFRRRAGDVLHDLPGLADALAAHPDGSLAVDYGLSEHGRQTLYIAVLDANGEEVFAFNDLYPCPPWCG